MPELRDQTFLGVSQQHLFFDAISLGILGIAFLVDALSVGRST